METLVGLLIPFLGTTLGAGMVFFMKNQMNTKVQKLLLGFAAGVMIAASIWSLIIPSLDMAEEQGEIRWLPAAIGFSLGIVFLLALDHIIPHLHLKTDKPEGIKAKFKNSTMMVLAVTLHNIPEGMAVGLALALACIENSGITTAFTLAIGMAIQNIPEGATISLPLRNEGMSRFKAFSFGAISGIVEPIGGMITVLLIGSITGILPYLLAFSAGAMVYVTVKELLPESQSEGKSMLGTVSFIIGFLLMMALDICLG